MTREERKKIYEALSAPFPEEAIERTDGRTTGRGYDTTGIKYQFVVNRFNEVLGVGGFRTQRTISVKENQTAKGRPCFEAICELQLELGDWVDGHFVPFAQAIADGGHVATSEADARKGSYTNAFKKAAAFIAGCGRQAYEGTLDDDNAELPAVRPITKRPSTRRKSGNSQKHNGRITVDQLDKLKALVTELGREWAGFRNYVREEKGVQLEYLDSTAANELVADLIARTVRRGSNGTSRGAA